MATARKAQVDLPDEVQNDRHNAYHQRDPSTFGEARPLYKEEAAVEELKRTFAQNDQNREESGQRDGEFVAPRQTKDGAWGKPSEGEAPSQSKSVSSDAGSGVDKSKK